MMDWSLKVHFTSLRLDLLDEWWGNILECRATDLTLHAAQHATRLELHYRCRGVSVADAYLVGTAYPSLLATHGGASSTAGTSGEEEGMAGMREQVERMLREPQRGGASGSSGSYGGVASRVEEMLATLEEEKEGFFVDFVSARPSDGQVPFRPHFDPILSPHFDRILRVS